MSPEERSIYRKQWKMRLRVEDPEHYNADKNDWRIGGTRVKNLVLERDGYKCQICGMTNQQHIEKWNYRIPVHHIDKQGRNSKFKNNSLDNLITQCSACHTRGHHLGVKRKKQSNQPVLIV